MPVALIALLLAGDIVTTAPPASAAPGAAAGAPQGVVGVDLPAFPRPARPVDKAPQRSWDRPSAELNFNSIPMFDDAAPPPPPPSTLTDQGSRCRRKETANGFIYSCGDPEMARKLEEDTQRMLSDLLAPR